MQDGVTSQNAHISPRWDNGFPRGGLVLVFCQKYKLISVEKIIKSQYIKYLFIVVDGLKMMSWTMTEYELPLSACYRELATYYTFAPCS